MLVISQEVIVLLVDIEVCAVVGDAGEHLLDAGRLLGLIDIAEKGESEFAMFHHYTIWGQR